MERERSLACDLMEREGVTKGDGKLSIDKYGAGGRSDDNIIDIGNVLDATIRWKRRGWGEVTKKEVSSSP